LAIFAGGSQEQADVMPDPRTWHSRHEWDLQTVVDAGTVKLPDGWLSGGDPWWSREGVSFELRLLPGAYPVRVALAVAEGEGKTWRECAAAELTVDAEARPTTWELVPTLAFATPGGGYWSEVGVACFAPTDWLATGPMSARDLRPPEHPGWGQLDDDDGDDELSLVLFTVGPQRGECLTFAGYDDIGRVTRVITDLGLLDVDPRTGPLPW
jgi:hypothetical protein